MSEEIPVEREVKKGIKRKEGKEAARREGYGE
jgi:hypothetical protein